MLLKEFNENDGDLLNIIKDTVNRFIIDEEYLGVCIISCLKKLLFATAGLENIIKLEKLPQIVAQIFKYQENFSACSIESKTYRIYIIPFYPNSILADNVLVCIMPVNFWSYRQAPKILMKDLLKKITSLRYHSISLRKRQPKIIRVEILTDDVIKNADHLGYDSDGREIFLIIYYKKGETAVMEFNRFEPGRMQIIGEVDLDLEFI